MTAVFIEKLLFMQAPVVPVTQEQNFSGCVCECSLSSAPLLSLLSDNYSLCQNLCPALAC